MEPQNRPPFLTRSLSQLLGDVALCNLEFRNKFPLSHLYLYHEIAWGIVSKRRITWGQSPFTGSEGLAEQCSERLWNEGSSCRLMSAMSKIPQLWQRSLRWIQTLAAGRSPCVSTRVCFVLATERSPLSIQ